MIEERKMEEFEDDRKKWKIYFDIGDTGEIREDTRVMVSFISNHNKMSLNSVDLEKLKQDLKDLGKLRIIKQGKKFLE